MLKMCALCLKDADLQKSHVVPRFFMSSLKAADGQYQVVFPQQGINKFGNDDGKQRLLCRSCETHLSKFESLGADLYKRWSAYPSARSSLHIPIQRTLELDYTKAKLMWLSVVWRAVVAQGPIWERCSLDDSTTETLRVRVLEGIPGEAIDFPIVAMIEETGVLKRMMRAPTISSELALGGVEVFRMLIGGFYFSMVLQEGFQAWANTPRLRSDGTWEALPQMFRFTEDKSFMDAANFVQWKAPKRRDSTDPSGGH